MSTTLASVLRCPACGSGLEPIDGDRPELVCSHGHAYPVVAGVPRFVAEADYASSFGRQWNRWATTQLDSANGTTIFRERFERYLGPPEALAGLRVLDAGCGAGAFMDLVAPYAAELVGFDLSVAVEAAQANVGAQQNTLVAQADIFDPPFAPASFDLVYCIGVLQHTPEPKAAFASLARLVKPGGRLAVWIYERSPWEMLKPRHILRKYTTRLSAERADKFIAAYAPKALRARRAAQSAPGGRLWRKLVPVADVRDYAGNPGRQLDDGQIHEWCLMDTHDMLITTYDLPQRADVVASWFRELGFSPERRPEAEAIAMIGTREP